jgi:hypothetical protein
MSITSKLRIARAPLASLPAPPNSFEVGRLFYATDTHVLYIGTGVNSPMDEITANSSELTESDILNLVSDLATLTAADSANASAIAALSADPVTPGGEPGSVQIYAGTSPPTFAGAGASGSAIFVDDTNWNSDGIAIVDSTENNIISLSQSGNGIELYTSGTIALRANGTGGTAGLTISGLSGLGVMFGNTALIDSADEPGTAGEILTSTGSGGVLWAPPAATIEVNGRTITSSSVINFENGNLIAITNPSGGNISVAFSGQLAQTLAPITHQFFTSYTASTGLFTQSALVIGDIPSLSSLYDASGAATTALSTAEAFTTSAIITEVSARNTAITSAVATETTRAEAAEALLASTISVVTDVTVETSRAEAAETVLQTNITSEASARASAITAEASARNTAIGVETTRAEAAEALLASSSSVTTAIGVETTRAEAAEALLVPKTTTVNGHALSSNVTVSASDITTGTLPHAQLPTLVSGDIPNNAANTTGTAGGLSANIAESQVTNLTTDLAARATTTSVTTAIGVETTRAEAAEALLAPLASPTFSGTVLLPTLFQIGATDTGISRTAAGIIAVGDGVSGDVSGTLKAASLFSGNFFGSATTSVVKFYGGSTYDTGISRLSAGAVAIGNGTAADYSGSLQLGALSQINATVGTSGSTNASPLHTLAANYYTGSASAQDLWTIQSSLAAGTNGASTLTLAHTGSTGRAAVSVPAGSYGVNGAFGLTFTGTNVGFTSTGTDIWIQSTSSGGYPYLGFFNGTTQVGGTAFSSTGMYLQSLPANTSIGLYSTMGTGAGPACYFGNFSTFTSSTLQQISTQITQTVNQTSTAGYTGLNIAISETGTGSGNKRLIDCYAGTTGTTSKFFVDNAGNVVNAGAHTVGGATPTVSTGQLGLGVTTATTATAGSNTLPANPVGFLEINLGGTMYKLPYYAV